MLAAITLWALVAVPAISFDFSADCENWRPSPLDKGSKVSWMRRWRGANGLLRIAGSTPPSFGAAYMPWRDWRGYRWLKVRLFVPSSAPNDLDVLFYIKDRHYWWYQASLLKDLRTGKRRFTRWRNRWLQVMLNIAPYSTDWQPGGHKKAWYGALRYPREVGIRVFSSKKWRGAILIDTIALSGSAPPLGRFDASQPARQMGKLEVQVSARKVPVYEKVEFTFPVQHEYENPFDPRVVDVQATFRGPDGRTMTVPGFFYQGYERKRDEKGNEHLIPVGRPVWKVRFSAPIPGLWRCRIKLRNALGVWTSDEIAFRAMPNPNCPGMVRISKKDPRYFELENGDFFFPLGMNMRDGGDNAAAQRGTFDFDEFVPLFAEHHIRFLRTWMCAWWVSIEWSPRYHSRFDGVGRYCMYNAWRLDYALDLACKYGMYVQLSFNRHGQIRRDKFDAEWFYNPYSVKNGGFVASPAMFFTDPRVKELFKQRYRYIVARWGWCPNIMSWELWNEVDLVEGYRPPEVAAWHREMARYLRSIDPWKHLITTHVCLYGAFGDELFGLPEIEYINADHYWRRKNAIGLMVCYQRRRQHRKPFLVIEYGPQTVELPVPFEVWQREFRVGLWASYMIPSAMPAVFWYHREWRQFKLWRYAEPLLAFDGGEDRRGAGYEAVRALTSRPREVAIHAMAGKPGVRFYVYSWDNMLFPSPDKVPQERWVRGITVSIYGVPPGRYRLELWSPTEGRKFAEAQVDVQGEVARFALPDFAQDIAGKLIPIRQ